jgi:hypothetical protein
MLFLCALSVKAQVPTSNGPGICSGVAANFNTTDNGFNAPSIYGSIFDSSFYYHAGRGYWTDYLPPTRVAPPGFPRVLNIISPPFSNPNPNGTFNVGFYYIVGNPALDRFQVRIISVTETTQGTVTNVEATSGVQFFSDWSVPTPYIDGTTTAVPDPTPLLNGFQGNVCIRLIDPDIINGPNTTFRVEVSYIVNEPIFAVFDNVSIGPSNVPLPVDFIGVVANRNDITKGVDLRWDVADEVNVKEYRVESSTDGALYSVAGKVEATGRSVYAFSDMAAPPVTLYYRIKSVDIDGKFKYSGVIRLVADSRNSYSNDMLVYPSPARNEVTVQHKRLIGQAKLILTSLDGKVMKVIFPTPGSSNTFVDVSSVPPGMYMLRLDDESGYGKSVKFIKN